MWIDGDMNHVRASSETFLEYTGDLNIGIVLYFLSIHSTRSDQIGPPIFSKSTEKPFCTILQNTHDHVGLLLIAFPSLVSCAVH
jgi:hypothetical protein